jgi:hypothetical protein
MSRVGTFTPQSTKPGPRAADRSADLPAATPPTDALIEALNEAAEVLKERERLKAVLEQTHRDIPDLLQQRQQASANLGTAEVHNGDAGQARSLLSAIETDLGSSVRRRAAAIDGLMSQEQDLQDALSQVERERESYARPVVARFEERYRAAFEALQMLWQEGDELAKLLRAPVDMPLPVRITGAVKACFIATADTKVERILPESAAPAVTDETATRMGGILDRLSAAIHYCQSLAAGRSRHVQTLTSNLPFSPEGLYKVRQSFNCSVSGLPFAAGTLVDCTLVSVHELQRLVAVRRITLESAGTSGTGSAKVA